MSGRWLLGLSAAGLLLLAAPSAGAEPERLDDADLAAVRGGIMTPLGYEVGFAAEVRTYMDGQLALETRLVWTDQGPLTERAGPLAPLAADSGWTAIIPSADLAGTTRLLQSVTPSQVLAVVLNTASDRNIRQDANITLLVPELGDLQRQVSAQRTSASLASEVGLALSGASTSP